MFVSSRQVGPQHDRLYSFYCGYETHGWRRMNLGRKIIEETSEYTNLADPERSALPTRSNPQVKRTVPEPSRTLGLVVVTSFGFVVALLGGSSHPDVIQLVALRPIAALFLFPTLYFLTSDNLVGARPLVVLMLALGGLMAMQLVPLPPDLWTSLPGRGDIAALERALGLETGWRPLSWSPARTLNALASLAVPLIALLVALSLRATRFVLFHTILGIALLDAGFKLVQIASGTDRSFYLYSSAKGYADGLFANENHSGVFSALAILLCARLAIQGLSQPKSNGCVLIYVTGAVLFLASVMIGGSRAALLCATLAVVCAVVALRVSISARQPHHNHVAKVELFGRRHALLWLIITAVLLALICAFLFFGRSPSLDGIISQDSFEDMRWKIAPILLVMIEQNWIFGIGFGAFEEYYRVYEPAELLMPVYINQAHNDVGQFLLEGGLMGVGLLVGISYWVFIYCFRIFRQGRPERWRMCYWLGVIAIIGMASTVDYPLRTPIFQVTAIWFLLALSKDSYPSQVNILEQGHLASKHHIENR